MSAATLSIKERILVIDDEEPIRFAMRDYFTSIGYIVDCAQELPESLVRAAQSALWTAKEQGGSVVTFARLAPAAAPTARRNNSQESRS